MNETNIKIIWDEVLDTYDVQANGKEIITGASQDEIEALTMREIIDLMTR